MQIRRAEQQDLAQQMALYEKARIFMAEHGNPRQWGNLNWPPQALIESDIQNGKSYVCVHQGRIVGTFFYDCGDHIEPSYDVIEEGAWIGEERYGVVHRITSDGSVRGIGSFCLNWAYEKSGHHIRIDTHPDNAVMQNLMKKLGFVYCGHIHVQEDDDIRLAYEKTDAQAVVSS